MPEYELIGFVGDTVGDESRLVQLAPALRLGEQEYVARGTAWTTDSLVPLRSEDRRFLNLFREDATHPISEGHTVWVAGRHFFSDVQSFHQVRLQPIGMGAWKTHVRGQRWSTGSPVAFDEFASRLSHFFRQKLCVFLFDPMEKSMGDADKAFDIYEALPIPDSRERELTRALFFGEKRDTYSEDFVRHEALSSGLFRSRRDFDKALTALREDLRRKRLSEGFVRQRFPGSPALRPELVFQFMADAATYRHYAATRFWQEFLSSEFNISHGSLNDLEDDETDRRTVRRVDSRI